MSFHYTKKDNTKYFLYFIVAVAVFINFAISSISTAVGLPLYLDTIGTIFVAIIGGALPAIITALISGYIINFLVSGYVYFSIINVFIAIFASWIIHFSKLNKYLKFIVFVLITSVVCSVVGMGIQYLIPGLPMLENLTEITGAFSIEQGRYYYFILVLASIFLNIIDKSISFIAAFWIYRLVPTSLKKTIENYGWKQKPLTIEEIKQSREKAGRKTLVRKVTVLLTEIIFLLSVILVWISITFYYEDCKEEYTSEAFATSQTVALLVDGDEINEFVKWGDKAEGYEDTKKLINVLLKNTQGVERLSIIIFENNGYLYLFQDTLGDVDVYDMGKVIPFPKEFQPFEETFKNGGYLNELILNDEDNVMTAVYPIKDSLGNTVAYAKADVYMAFLSEYAKDYLIKTFLCFAGFICAILVLGFTMAGYDLVFPIYSITSAARMFLESHGDQKALDDNVRKSRQLAIKTEDEIEQLFSALCEMESEMAEYVRDLKHYADATKKMQNGLIITLASIVEHRDSDSNYHVQNTASYVRIILNGLRKKGYYPEKITDEYIEELEMSAPLHDIGKIHISDSIVNKHDNLTDEEKEIMKTHTIHGREIIEKAIDTVKGDTYLKEARNMAAYHHERWDGTGYPEGLHGEVIPLSARIMALANALDDLTTFKRFKATYSLDEALDMIKAESGKKFDPKCVEALLCSLNEVKVVLNNKERKGR